MKPTSRLQLFAVIGPGLLVAATGIGAGDLATAAFTGSRLGTAVLWAVVVGAFLKFVLNEGLARWQLATGETLLEGAVRKFGFVVAAVFLPYFLVWSFLVALALMSACGVTMHAMVPVFSDRIVQIFGRTASHLSSRVNDRWVGRQLGRHGRGPVGLGRCMMCSGHSS